MTPRSLPLLALGTVLWSGCSPDGRIAHSPLEPGISASLASAEVTETDAHVVLFRAAGRPPADYSKRVQARGGTVLRVHPEIGMAVVRGLTDAAAVEAVGEAGWVARDTRALRAPVFSPEIDAAGPVTLSETAAASPTAAALFHLQWNMRAIQADHAWRGGITGSPEVRVAILDTGIDPDHVDLRGKVDHASSTSFYPAIAQLPRPGVAPVYADPAWADDSGHGTHVAGIVSTNGMGVAGVAPNVTLIAVKVLDVYGRGADSEIIAGILHAANVGADVINLSLGGFESRSGNGVLTAAYQRAFSHAQRRGALVVSAAGNEARDLDDNGAEVRFPCEAALGICVSATGPDDTRSWYSNFGASAINVAAPGGHHRPGSSPFTWFDVPGRNGGSMVLSLWSSRSVWLNRFVPSCRSGRCYFYTQGTSMATPHVSGLAALLDSQHGGRLNAAQLQTAIQRGTDDLGTPGMDAEFGHGRINVARALGLP
jgi:subtilisin family serine protease